MQSNYNTPLKRCTKCGNEFPATTEYFYRKDSNTPVRLRPNCKLCHSEQVKLTRDPDKRREYERKWAANNKEKRRRSSREWRNRNIEEQRKRERAVKRNDPNHSKRARDWEKKNPEKKKENRREYAKNNRDKLKSILNRYVARKRSLADDFSEDDWQFALNYFNGCCAVCGRSAGFWHTLAMDHWVPLNNPDCPGTIPRNIIPLCHGVDGCNNSKHDKSPHEWLTQKYGKKKAGAILNRIHGYFSLVRKTD